MPTTVALSSLKIALARLAISRASVVLPQLKRCQSYCDLEREEQRLPRWAPQDDTSQGTFLDQGRKKRIGSSEMDLANKLVQCVWSQSLG